MNIMNLSEVMDRSLAVLKKYFKSFFIYSLAWYIFMIVAFVVVGIICGIALVFAVKSSSVIFVGAIAAVFVIFAIIVSLVSNIGIIKITEQDFNGENVYAGDAIKISFKKLFPAAGLIIVELILSLPVIAVFGAACYIIYRVVKTAAITNNWYSITAIMIIIAAIILILLFVFFVVAFISVFAFSFQSMVIENAGIFKCIGKSLKLIKGNFWRIFGSVILFLIVMYTLNMAIGALIGIITGAAYAVMNFLSIKQDFVTFFTVAITYLRWPISIISDMVISPMFTIMITVMYYNQRFKKEGYNLILKLDKIRALQGEEETGGNL
ncbi:hypothetical protein [Clostridium oryzae]|uniref:Membrane domain of glycerophosphoryl diester phosphodiesterase n=1 Tax=Clostridium oryzae TaxID=1450648 RepID=A0A1V4IQ08_9CLOT|nr:hypothetical protein [Clostridium oryzae]OPJ62131.1 hypothetical protein CLORY_19540 [Clostridium oryzae]